MKNWFEEIEVTRKREDLAKLLVRLKENTKGEENIVLPTLTFPTQDGVLKPKPVETKATKADADKKKGDDEAKTSQTPASAETPSTTGAVQTTRQSRSISLTLSQTAATASASPSTETTTEPEKYLFILVVFFFCFYLSFCHLQVFFYFNF